MSDASARIKNLSIALEALSRINNGGATALFARIQAVLAEETSIQEKETRDRRRPAPPAKPTSDDDDIPF
jgi:hypothetical protein